jgi:Putative rhamnosyl transferase
MPSIAAPTVLHHHHHLQKHLLGNNNKKRTRRMVHRSLTRTYLALSLLLVWLLTTFRSVLLFKKQQLYERKAAAAADSTTGTETAAFVVVPLNNNNNGTTDVASDYYNYYVDDHGEEASIVHVIQTRFMQMQPGLAALAQARLRLFTSFTLPSMQQQTSQRFLWIIRTDPDLHAATLEQLKRLIVTMPNAVLVASNQNPEGFRGAAIDDITEQSLLVGDLQLVRSYHNASITRRLIETRLDADDALHLHFCAFVQERAMQQLHQGWLVWCAERHVEWHFVSPWPAGTLLGVQTPQCVTPGLTYGYMPGTTRSHITIRNNHASLHKRLPACDFGGGSANQQQASSLSSSSSSCLARTGPMPLALRARTPTSAGMDGVASATSILSDMWRDAQPKMWQAIPTVFGISEDDLTATRLALETDLPAIIQDAISGQCTKGHSCKESSLHILQSILNATTQQKLQLTVQTAKVAE